MLIPVFSLIVLESRDRAWWWIYTLSSLALLLWLEWGRDTWVPRFAEGLEGVDARTWRTMAMFMTVVLTVMVVQRFHRDLHRARKAMQASYERSETLILNILPASIAKRLKGAQERIADDVEEASVLFADLVGFTKIASQQTASETVNLLNAIFSEFDRAVDAHGLEKIKTIGDAYMAAAGVPTPRPDHVAQLLRLAEAMLEIVDQYNQTSDYALQLRVGVSSGPLTAGVIGARKFTYDIWGDTVNVASRMESTGIPGRIQVTPNVAKAAAEHFEFEDRGAIQVKGKGEMQTFLLTQSTD
jgi:class 3 adenylate cyclase